MKDNGCDAVIIDGARTPMARGGAGGALCGVPAEVFGGHLIGKLVERSGIDPTEINDVILGNVMGAYLCFARLCLLSAGLPPEIPGVSLDRNCASGLQAIAFASQAIRCGEAELIIAGGAESMTRQPWYFDKPSHGYSRLPLEPRVLSRITAPPRFGGHNMGETAENVAQRYSISRQAQEELAVESHLRAQAAWEAGKFAPEVIPVPVPGRGGQETLFERDETIRPPDPGKMAKLPTIFREDGTVTAATSSPFTDGAAAVVMMSRDRAESRGLAPLARVVASASVGVEPAYMGMGPVPATRLAMDRAGLRIGDIGLVEMNEAFAAQALACYQELGLNREIVNVNGGGMALGHPIAATGARLSTTLINEMRRRQVRYGLATMCVGGGQGTAVIYELL
ncbi:MAG: thiolase family protein [Proteobacteria bacterium]|nr:thiolase family protein [Pseudomonadota bacterium]MBU1451469.1 thiolase family protein [Pseudomonadota bacterium]MBU2470496.1 thiolase family protein [Pseudomonadota bacterium]MBU2516404.1 thiolase family protein [Pseudomonadota bacterium]